MTSNITRKSFIGFGIYALLFAAIIFFLLNPTLAEIEKNKKAIISEQKELTANYDEISSLQKIMQDQQGFENIKATVLGYLPASLNSSQFIVEVEGLAKKTDITINSVSMNATPSAVSKESKTTTTTTTSDAEKKETTAAKTKKGTQQNEFSLSTKADFAKTMSFIAQMEKLSRFNSISAISITSIENNGADVKITGNIFYEQQ